MPPTLALCRQYFGARAPVVFGWVFAAHQVGAALAAFGAGVVREATGSYDAAWYGAAALCLVAAALSVSVRRRPADPHTTLPVTPAPASAVEAHG